MNKINNDCSHNHQLIINESEAKFRGVFDYSSIGMAIVSIEGRWIKVNKSLSKLLGYSEEEILKTSFQDITHPLDLKKDLEYVNKMLIGEIDTYQLEKRYFHKQGTIVWGLLSVSMIKDIDNKPLYFISQITDITTLKKTEVELNEKNKELERSNFELRHFAFIASHDLQEPLYSLGKYIEKLSDIHKQQIDSETYKLINTSFEVIKKMKKFTAGLLDYSSAGKQKVIEEVDSAKVIEKVTENALKAIIEKRNAVITCNNLPVIKADPIKIEQIFQNLISNAIKYCDITPEINITASLDEGYWLFSVDDNGIGIDEKYQLIVFEIFKRLHNNDKYKGTGIGLALCKKIIESYGGNIWIESKKQGSIFYFTLPA